MIYKYIYIMIKWNNLKEYDWNLKKNMILTSINFGISTNFFFKCHDIFFSLCVLTGFINKIFHYKLTSLINIHIYVNNLKLTQEIKYIVINSEEVKTNEYIYEYIYILKLICNISWVYGRYGLFISRQFYRKLTNQIC